MLRHLRHLCVVLQYARCSLPVARALLTDGVAPHWMPQLQLHMIAAGTHSALLVSRSVTKVCVGGHLYSKLTEPAHCVLCYLLLQHAVICHTRMHAEAPTNAGRCVRAMSLPACSCAQGVRVFRVWRDDEFIYRMLALVSK